MNKTFLTVFALIGIFLCGSVVGGIVAMRYVRPFPVKKAAEQQLSSPQWTRIPDRLNPTAEQREKISAIIAAFLQEQQNVRKATQAATEKAHADITAVLTPEQRAEYEKNRARLRDNERAWQRWIREQRAKYGERPFTPPGVLPPQQPATNSAGKDNPKRPGGKQGGGKKQPASQVAP